MWELVKAEPTNGHNYRSENHNIKNMWSIFLHIFICPGICVNLQYISIKPYFYFSHAHTAFT